MRLGPAVHRRCVDQRGEVVGDDDHAVVRRRAGVQRRHRAFHAHAEGAVPLSPSFPESRRGAADHRRVHHPLQHRVAHRATRPSDAGGRENRRDGSLTDETRSLSGVRIDDQGRGRYVRIPLACPKNRERYKLGHRLAYGHLIPLPPCHGVGRERFGSNTPPSIYDRYWLGETPAEPVTIVDRWRRVAAKAAACEAEMIRLAETTQPPQTPQTLSLTYYGACSFHLLKGDWTRARSLIERCIEVARAGNVIVFLRLAVASSAWILAQFGETGTAVARHREGEQLVQAA